MVPVIDRPVMAHVVDLCRRQGLDQLVASLHCFPDAIEAYFGDSVEYRYEGELLGTAGGLGDVRDFFGDDLIVVIPGDALTDIDLNRVVKRHKSHGGITTLTVNRVDDMSEHSVVLHGSDGRVWCFQGKPHPDEALSDLAVCGVYCFSPEIFDYFPPSGFVDWATDVFPVLLEHDVAFYTHETGETGMT
jgi:mannose-1-phosphate guanylyltransferase